MIEAAGGVVLRGRAPDLEVLVVHRPRHADWSLPKGKLDADEPASDAAVREVEEETGVRAELVRELPDTRYTTAAGPKRVRWYLMAPVSGDPAERHADDEVDVARWLSFEEAVERLTYDRDVDLLQHAIAGASP